MIDIVLTKTVFTIAVNENLHNQSAKCVLQLNRLLHHLTES